MRGPFPLSPGEIDAVIAPVLSQNLLEASQPAAASSSGDGMSNSRGEHNIDHRTESALLLLDRIEKRIVTCAANLPNVTPSTLPDFRQELSDLRKAISDVRRRVPAIEQRKVELLDVLTQLQRRVENLEEQPAASINPVIFDSGKPLAHWIVSFN